MPLHWFKNVMFATLWCLNLFRPCRMQKSYPLCATHELSTVVPSSYYCYPLSLLCTHFTSTTLFPVLSKHSVLVLSFEYLTDNSKLSSSFSFFFLKLRILFREANKTTEEPEQLSSSLRIERVSLTVSTLQDSV
jgi:hypothetical protein